MPNRMSRHRIPVRVGTTPVSTRPVYPEAPEAAATEAIERAQQGSQSPRGSADLGAQPATGVRAPSVAEAAFSGSEEGEDSAFWRERALRLQAEMDNYRKRQRRVAQEEAQAGQERLLHDVLSLADNLERALAAAPQQPGGRVAADGRTAEGLRRGVELTRDDLLRVLARHGVERFEALGEPFDPAWHEAVHVVSARALGVEPGTVVEQVQPGYRRREGADGERLFRPAQVVVAN
jgi:molecular chaperone GrpE